MHKGVTCASSQNPQNPFKEFFIIILFSLPNLTLKNSLFFWVLYLSGYFFATKKNNGSCFWVKWILSWEGFIEFYIIVKKWKQEEEEKVIMVMGEMRKSFKDSLKALEADIQFANTL